MNAYERISDSIKRGVVQPLYLFYGEENYLIETLLLEFQQGLLTNPGLQSFNFDLLDGSECSAEQVVAAADNLPLMTDKRLVIVREARFFGSTCLKKDQETLIGYFKNPALSTCLIFTTATVDRRLKQFKELTAHGMAAEFSPLKPYELEQWLKGQINTAGKKISREALAYLPLTCGNSLQQLSNELEKLFCYLGDRQDIRLNDVEAVASRTTELSIFRVVDALGEKKVDRALTEIKEMLNTGEAPLRILAMIVRQFNLLLQAKDLQLQELSKAAMAQQLKLPAFVADKCCRQAANFSRDDLLYILRQLWQTDIELKSGGPDFYGQMERVFLALVL